ncbi:hypothetical protein E2C01_020450 [Portunus trituberculatus]|uniref:Secreted protein n=1 Tax=Portunus trituberculatus TaxID=210409 RepID=A0A5B7DZT0_PORTR|nr:hypothetical protein [Portunus trituberculatus]
MVRLMFLTLLLGYSFFRAAVSRERRTARDTEYYPSHLRGGGVAGGAVQWVSEEHPREDHTGSHTERHGKQGQQDVPHAQG